MRIFQRISNIQELYNLVSSWADLNQGIPEVILKSKVRKREMMGILELFSCPCSFMSTLDTELLLIAKVSSVHCPGADLL